MTDCELDAEDCRLYDCRTAEWGEPEVVGDKAPTVLIAARPGLRGGCLTVLGFDQADCAAALVLLVPVDVGLAVSLKE